MKMHFDRIPDDHGDLNALRELLKPHGGDAQYVRWSSNHPWEIVISYPNDFDVVAQTCHEIVTRWRQMYEPEAGRGRHYRYR